MSIVPVKTGRRIGVSEIGLVVLLVGLIGLAIIVAINPDVYQWNVRLYQAWTGWALSYGYIGAFVTALIGNITVVVVFPYTMVTFFLATTGLNSIWLGIVTGLGAVIGEFSGYAIGRWGSRVFQRQRPETFFTLQRAVHRRPLIVPALLFIFSVLPLPDDVLFIPLGMLRYPMWKVVIPAALGKIVAGCVIALAGHSARWWFQDISIGSAILYEIGTLMVVVLALYAMTKIRWSDVLRDWLARAERM